VDCIYVSASPCAGQLFPFTSGTRTLVHGNGVAPGSVYNYMCELYYDLIGSHTVECVNGVWTPDVPTCQSKYGILDV
jgi:hypothetical protein